MSWQAMEAVYDHSQICDPYGRSVLLAIARHMDADGIVGNAGRRSAPTQRRYIDHACVTASTFHKWVDAAIQAGELSKITHGSGRGSWCEYRLLLLNNDPPQRSLQKIDTPEQSTGLIVPVDQYDDDDTTIDPLDAIIDPLDKSIDPTVGSDTKDTKDTEEKEKKKSDDHDHDDAIATVEHVIANYRRLLGVGNMARRPDYGDAWIIPINSLLQRVNWDAGRAIQLLAGQYATNVSENKPTWPDSVVPRILEQLTAANGHHNGHQNGHAAPAAVATALELANARLAQRRAAIGETA